MKNIMVFAVLFLCIIVVSCNNTNQTSNAKYQIEVTKELKTTPVSDFINKTTYIQLELNDKSLIGYITKLQVKNNRIYALDPISSNSLLVFNIKGKFLFSIRRIGNGPGEYQLITDFSIDDKQNHILLQANGRKIIHFNSEGKFIKEQKLPLLNCSSHFPLNDNKFILLNGVATEDKQLVYLTDDDFNIEHTYIETPKGWERICRYPEIGYSECNKKYLFAYTNSTRIFEINNNGVLPKYDFNIPPKIKLTDEIVEGLKGLDERSLTKRTFKYFSIESYYDMKRRLFVVFSVNNKKYWGLYDREKNAFEYVCEDNVTSVSTGEFVPPRFLSQMNENTIVGTIDSRSILKKDSVKIFNGITITKDSNPLVVICKMKG